MAMEELRKMMCIPADASKGEIEIRFKSIAEILMNECVIEHKNEEEKSEEYRILDFEFYFYSKDHQDISVHPRKSKALCWYINDFGGIDLNFESNIEPRYQHKGKKLAIRYELKDDSYFGGILIRQIQKLSGNKEIYDSPLKVAELFRVLDATSQKQNTPILKMKKLDIIDFQEPQPRYNILGSHKNNPKAKADYNLQECFTGVSDSKKKILEEELAKYAECKYRYCWSSQT